MAQLVKISIGDCFRIPLSNSFWGYCQYIAWNESHSYLVRVFDVFTSSEDLEVSSLDHAAMSFPPVFVELKASVRSGRWKKIGNLAVNNFTFPQFRISSRGTKPGVYDDWWLWDGTREWQIGALPQQLRKLELRQVWGDEALEQRIVDGTYRGDLMF